MSTPPRPTKRKLDDAPISPPPMRRKLQSNTTRRKLSPKNGLLDTANVKIETAVASFFTPTSQKPLEQITWQERAPNDDTSSTLLVGKFVPRDGASKSADNGIQPEIRRRKIAAFDFVGDVVLDHFQRFI